MPVDALQPGAKIPGGGDVAGLSKISQGIKKNFSQRGNTTYELRKEPV